MLEIKLFGEPGFADSTSAEPISLRNRALLLVAWLLLNRAAPTPRERVAFALWPDTTEQNALGTLRRALSDLRAGLPPQDGRDWVLAARGQLQWNSQSPYWLDVEELERGIRRSTPATLHEAVALYEDDLFPGLDAEWIVLERERLRQLYVEAVRRLISHHRALAEYRAARDLVARLVAVDPLSESVQRELMALHYLDGDRAAALAAYENLRGLLWRELGVRPTSETESLVAAIRSETPLPAPAKTQRAGDLAARARPSLPRLVGRHGELDTLADMWEAAAAGHGRTAIVSGEAGVGKSHLVQHLADHADRRGGLVLTGHCYEFEQALPYQPVVEMLRGAASMLSHAEIGPTQRAALARIAPDVLGALDGPEPDGVAPGGMRIQLFEALLQAFLALARNQPTLLLLEDAHWASESTLDWLTYVTPRVDSVRLLVVVTYRTEEVGAGHVLARLQRRFVREHGVLSLPLAPLSQTDTRELVALRSGLGDEQSRAVADRLYVESAGNPFFLQEIVRSLKETGEIVVEGDRWTGPFVDDAGRVRIALPETLRASLAARVERLSENASTFIRAAAAAGRVFSFDVVQRAGRWREDDALQALEDALAREFIRADTDDQGFAFCHHLVREAIYADMPKPHRCAWHRRIAGAIEAVHPGDDSQLGELAHHLFQGQAWERAADCAMEFARQAEARYADDEALLYYRQALDALAKLPETTSIRERRYDIIVPMERAADRRSDRALEGKLLHEMLALARELGDDIRIALAQCCRGQYLRLIGQPREALQALKESRERAAAAVAVGQPTAAPMLVSALELSAMAAGVLGEYAAARALFDQARAYYAKVSFPPDYPLGRWRFAGVRNLAEVFLFEGRFQAALDRGEEALAGFQNTPGVPRYEIGLSMQVLGWVYTFLGAIEPARKLLTQAHEIVTATGIRFHVAYTDQALAQVQRLEGLLSGDLTSQAGARALFAPTVAVFREMGAAHTLALTLPRLAPMELEVGNVATARTLCLESLELSRGMEAAMREVVALAGLAECHLATGETEAALAVSSEAIERFEALGEDSKDEPTIRYTHSRALLAAGRRAEAWAPLQRAHQALCRQADELRDPELRESLLNNVPPHAEIMAAWERDV